MLNKINVVYDCLSDFETIVGQGQEQMNASRSLSFELLSFVIMSV